MAVPPRPRGGSPSHRAMSTSARSTTWRPARSYDSSRLPPGRASQTEEAWPSRPVNSASEASPVKSFTYSAGGSGSTASSVAPGAASTSAATRRSAPSASAEMTSRPGSAPGPRNRSMTPWIAARTAGSSASGSASLRCPVTPIRSENGSCPSPSGGHPASAGLASAGLISAGPASLPGRPGGPGVPVRPASGTRRVTGRTPARPAGSARCTGARPARSGCARRWRRRP